jgi:outer membrane protein assembly factor BamB
MHIPQRLLHAGILAFWFLCGLGGVALPQAGPAGRPADWPQFRGPGGLGLSQEKNLPVRWGPQENVVWKTALPGPGGSSPIVLGDRIFLTCYSGYGVPGTPGGSPAELKRHLLCLNRADGRIAWNREIPPASDEQAYEGYVQRHGYASSTPATDGERIYCFFGKRGVMAFDLTGKPLWTTSVGTGEHRYGSGTSPVVYKNHVIVNACVEGGSLVALDRKTGREVWRAGEINEAWNTPLLIPLPGDKTELAVAIRGQVLGFDPATGRKLWNCEGTDDYITPSMVAHEGIVYALLGRMGLVMAVRASGRGDVTQSHRLWRFVKGRNVASPVIFQGHLYFVTEQEGVLRCLDAKTGNAVFEERLKPAPGDVYASPLVADGKLYVVSRERGAYVLAAEPRFEQLAHNELGDRSVFNGSPVPTGGRLLLRSDRFLYCIGAK